MAGVTAPTLAELRARHAGAGRVAWIGVRPARRAEMVPVDAVEVTPTGLDGDRHPRDNGRAVTLIQAEHLPVIAALSRLDAVAPATLRRNIVVSGINLIALKGMHVRLGGAVIKFAAICAPCSRMEEALGPGGYTAMRGHGGWTARVITPGPLRVGDVVWPVSADA